MAFGILAILRHHREIINISDGMLFLDVLHSIFCVPLAIFCAPLAREILLRHQTINFRHVKLKRTSRLNYVKISGKKVSSLLP